jgi:hypothetical protein
LLVVLPLLNAVFPPLLSAVFPPLLSAVVPLLLNAVVPPPLSAVVPLPLNAVVLPLVTTAEAVVAELWRSPFCKWPEVREGLPFCGFAAALTMLPPQALLPRPSLRLLVAWLEVRARLKSDDWWWYDDDADTV